MFGGAGWAGGGSASGGCDGKVAGSARVIRNEGFTGWL